jgi:hypothetical protein
MSSIDRIIVHFTGISPYLVIIFILAGIGLAFWYYHDPVPPASPRMKAFLIFLRAAALSALFIALGEPVVKIVYTITQAAKVVVLLDTSSSMERFGEGLRKSEALDALQKIRSSLGNQGLYIGFDDKISPLKKDVTTFTGPATDIALALRNGESEKKVSAVILVSDGRWNRGEDPIESVKNNDIPVYTILTGPPGTAQDIILRRVSAATVGHSGWTIPVEITVASTIKRPAVIPVEILERNRTVAAGKISLGEAASGQISIELPLKDPGDHLFTVRITPGFEENKENNSRSFGVHVLKSSFAVLLMAHSPSVDLAFIRRVLEADKAFSVTTVIGERDITSTGLAYPDDISKFDAVILVDGGSVALTPPRAQKLVSWLSSGKGLWLLGTIPPQSTVLEGALPLSIDRGAGIFSASFTTVLTEAGRIHYITAAPYTVGLWEILPPLSSIMPVTVNQQGHPLAVTGGLTVKNTPLPVIVVGTYGRGKTLVMPVSGIWRWRLMMEGAGKSGDFYDTLIKNIVRWLTSETETSPLTVTTDSKSYLSGQEIFFEGRVFDSVYMPVSGAEVSLTVDNDPSQKVILEEKTPGIYTGVTRSTSPGNHSFTSSAYVNNKLYAEQKGSFGVENYSLEMLDSSPDPQLLGDLAHKTGGFAVTFAGTDSILSRVKISSASERGEKDYPINLNPLMPLLVIFFLTVEWAIRKRRGMI